MKSESLYFVDITMGGIHRCASKTGQESKINLDGTVEFVTHASVVGGQNRTISHVDWDTANITDLAEVEQGTRNRFSDGKYDVLGRLWAGTMGFETIPRRVDSGQGSLYSLTTDHKLTKHVGNIEISNGIDWTDDNSVMFYIDSVPRKVYAFDFNIEERTVSNQRTVVKFEPGTESTFLWRSFQPHISHPVCFGGKNLDKLYFTYSMWKLPEKRTNLGSLAYLVKPDFAATPLAGYIFKVTGLGVKGRAPNNFKD
ncbi:unnamed protein product [Candidula unifasciata]|uniref:SMP-30/Gluconolactonase/LRE-like region domain-containing protein n=1 Tax=Candidula unifasciata TaxID=100452 RepID=A0A8S3YNY7_9EUPU|nr:unnamed protein product [Candidula unifasciata]